MGFSPGSSAPLRSVASGAGTLGLGALGVSGRLLSTATMIVLSFDGQGGQSHARRNAWASMSEAHQGSLERRTANDAMALALAAASGHPAGSARRRLDRMPPLAR